MYVRYVYGPVSIMLAKLMIGNEDYFSFSSVSISTSSSRGAFRVWS
jgi:hypothetical protein